MGRETADTEAVGPDCCDGGEVEDDEEAAAGADSTKPPKNSSSSGEEGNVAWAGSDDDKRVSNPWLGDVDSGAGEAGCSLMISASTGSRVPKDPKSSASYALGLDASVNCVGAGGVRAVRRPSGLYANRFLTDVDPLRSLRSV